MKEKNNVKGLLKLWRQLMKEGAEEVITYEEYVWMEIA